MRINRGFTLVEIIVVIAITGILAGILAGILGRGFSNYFFAQAVYEQVDIDNIAANRMAKEMKRGILITQATANQVTYTNYDGDSISYSLSGNVINRSVNGGANQPLLNNVTAFTISYSNNTFTPAASAANAAVVTFSITTLFNDTTHQLITSSYLRNYS